MWNILEQPWTGLLLAFAAFLVIGTLRTALPAGRWPRPWAVALALACGAVALDYGIATDHEKVEATLKHLIKAVQAQDVQAIGRLMAPDYRDGYHRSKERLMTHAATRFAKPVMEKISILSLAVDEPVTAPKAAAQLSLIARFKPDSDVARLYKPAAMVVIQIHLTKQSNAAWLIQGIELLEVDKQPVSWGQVLREF